MRTGQRGLDVSHGPPTHGGRSHLPTVGARRTRLDPNAQTPTPNPPTTQQWSPTADAATQLPPGEEGPVDCTRTARAAAVKRRDTSTTMQRRRRGGEGGPRLQCGCGAPRATAGKPTLRGSRGRIRHPAHPVTPHVVGGNVANAARCGGSWMSDGRVHPEQSAAWSRPQWFEARHQQHAHEAGGDQNTEEAKTPAPLSRFQDEIPLWPQQRATAAGASSRPCGSSSGSNDNREPHPRT